MFPVLRFFLVGLERLVKSCDIYLQIFMACQPIQNLMQIDAT